MNGVLSKEATYSVKNITDARIPITFDLKEYQNTESIIGIKDYYTKNMYFDNARFER